MAEKEFIERERVYDIFGAKQQELLKYHRYYQLNDAAKEEFDLYDSYMDEVESIPAADVVEVRHGEWSEPIGYNVKCSRCRKYSQEMSNYCPNCGAIMGGRGINNVV